MLGWWLWVVGLCGGGLEWELDRLNLRLLWCCKRCHGHGMPACLLSVLPYLLPCLPTHPPPTKQVIDLKKHTATWKITVIATQSSAMVIQPDVQVG